MITTFDYLLLVAVWGCWCFFHSWLISPTIEAAARRSLGAASHYYRLLYNLFSAISLMVPLFISNHLIMREITLMTWHGPANAVRLMIIGGALILLIVGACRYDMARFLGFDQLSTDSKAGESTGDKLETGGMAGFVRHPWYLAGILLVWAGPPRISRTSLIVGGVLSAYFVIGAFLEERKLLVRYGSSYSEYQQRVSMFLPIKWLASAVQRMSNR